MQKAPCTVVSQTPRPKGQKLTSPVGLGPVRAFWFKPNGQVVVCTVGSLDLATVQYECLTMRPSLFKAMIFVQKSGPSLLKIENAKIRILVPFFHRNCTLLIYWSHFFDNRGPGAAVTRGPWPGGIRGGYTV